MAKARNLSKNIYYWLASVVQAAGVSGLRIAPSAAPIQQMPRGPASGLRSSEMDRVAANASESRPAPTVFRRVASGGIFTRSQLCAGGGRWPEYSAGCPGSSGHE
jgi:hypothetical protein